ncbi:unnamed protein product [Brassica oleracea var. botrytis]
MTIKCLTFLSCNNFLPVVLNHPSNVLFGQRLRFLSCKNHPTTGRSERF